MNHYLYIVVVSSVLVLVRKYVDQYSEYCCYRCCFPVLFVVVVFVLIEDKQHFDHGNSGHSVHYVDVESFFDKFEVNNHILRVLLIPLLVYDDVFASLVSSPPAYHAVGVVGGDDGDYYDDAVVLVVGCVVLLDAQRSWKI